MYCASAITKLFVTLLLILLPLLPLLLLMRLLLLLPAAVAAAATTAADAAAGSASFRFPANGPHDATAGWSGSRPCGRRCHSHLGRGSLVAAPAATATSAAAALLRPPLPQPPQPRQSPRPRRVGVKAMRQPWPRRRPDQLRRPSRRPACTYARVL